MTDLQKIDLFKQYKADYIAPKKPVLLEPTSANYLSIEGMGEPGGEAFSNKAAALYAMAYTVKMTRKSQGLQDYVVCKLEAIWTHDQDPMGFHKQPKEEWRWQLLIRIPDFINAEALHKASEALISKGKPEEVKNVGIETLFEGTCVQMLHVGPYEEEQGTVEMMAAHAGDHDLILQPGHHEIYLSDPRRVKPDRLKTILRCPVSHKDELHT